MTRFAYINPMKEFCKITGLLVLLSLGGSAFQLEAQDSFKLFASRFPQETVSRDSVDFKVTVHSSSAVSPGAQYSFDFGVSASLHILTAGSLGKLTSSNSADVVSADGYSVTMDSTPGPFTEIAEEWDHNLTVSPTYMDTRFYTFNLYPGGTDSGTAIWFRNIALAEWWLWDYEGGWQVGWNPDTWTQLVPLAFTKSYSINLPAGPSTGPDQSPPVCSKCACKAMAVYSFDQLRAGLVISDTPVSYQAVFGPSVSFTTTYNQRDVGQSGGPAVASLGPLWTYSALSYISGVPLDEAATASRFVPGGGVEVYSGYQFTAIIDSTTPILRYGTFAPERNSQAILSWDPVNQLYTRTLPSGAWELYGQKVIESGGTSCFLITSQTDPQGNTVTYSYDSQNRITTITDAALQKTTFSYANQNPMLITKVTDPFGRSVTFSYDNIGRLTSATDPVGIVSLYGYDNTNFITSLTTPYGTTTFSTLSDANHQVIQAVNPLGQGERVELRYASAAGISDTATVPSAAGLLATGSGLSQNNSFYWDRRAVPSPPPPVTTSLDYTQAKMTHWMNGPRGLTNVADSQKLPLEGRVWYTYQGQTIADLIDDSDMNLAIVTARILDDGTTQHSYASYNINGLVKQSVDPLGRTTIYSYYSNNQDLNQVTQVNGSGQDILSTMSSYVAHQPQTVVDAAGQPTYLTYNGQGQMLTSKNALNQITTFSYTSNYLTQVQGPSPESPTTTYTYDSCNRVATVKDTENYTLTMAYDNLDRPTSTLYPDGSTDLTYYKILDVDHTVDRQARTTYNKYDAIRELIQTTDPMGRTTKYGWCTCGGLATLTDANGNLTTWNHDLQGRVTSKVYADTSQITYLFETTTSRLHKMTDAGGNSAVYAYNPDNTLSTTTYAQGSGFAAIPTVSFTYDTPYNRVLTMMDGSGTTHYTYNLVNQALGFGRLASVTVPIYGTGSFATVAYQKSTGAVGYDELGRVVGRRIDPTGTNANNVYTTFDTLGRVTNVSNALGAFVYAYVSQTSRLYTVTYPTSPVMKTTYTYFPSTNTQDQERLQTIQNQTGSTQLSRFDYTYNKVGTIATWTQQADNSTAVLNTLTYDNADQLINAVQSGGATASNAYGYDPAGNRLAEVTGSGTTAGQFNTLNQLTGTSTVSTGTQTVTGYTSAAITNAMVNAVPATISNNTNFTAHVPLPLGTNVVSVIAQPSSGVSSAITKRYQIVMSSGATVTPLTYDVNGNCTKDEHGNTYTWDALNRLTKITYLAGGNSTFAYDGLSRRVQIVDTTSGGAVTTKNYLWIGSEIAEERNSSNAVTKRFFPQGEQQSPSGTATPYYYTRDHLGSVREMCNSSGTIVARYSYDLYGRAPAGQASNLVSGTNLATRQYAGMLFHTASGLNLTVADGDGSTGRPYGAVRGRFLSRDPMGEDGGINLYDYCGNQPVTQSDVDGLSPTMSVVPGEKGRMSQEVNISATCTTCKDVRFIQVAKSSYSGSSATDGHEWESPYYGNMMGMGSTGKMRDWVGAGHMNGDKRVDDWPGLLPTLFGMTMEFETCAYCADNFTYPKLIGCRHWKVHWDSNGKETFEGDGTDLSPQAPTPFFNDMQQSRYNYFKP